MTPTPIQIMLIEDHPEYRESLELVLGKAPDIELTHQFGSAEQALHFLQYDSPKSAPDLILLDLNLPGLSGIEAIPWFKKYTPSSPIIILTQSNREPDVVAAISSGASGYLLKSASSQQLTEAIRFVKEGGALLDPHVAQYILKTLQTKAPVSGHDPSLSNRELEVLSLLGEGLAKKEIAHRLQISAHTVGNHIRHIYEKLHVPNAPAAITKAYRSGILPGNSDKN